MSTGQPATTRKIKSQPRCDWCGVYVKAGTPVWFFPNWWGTQVEQVHCPDCRIDAARLAANNVLSGYWR